MAHFNGERENGLAHSRDIDYLFATGRTALWYCHATQQQTAASNLLHEHLLSTM